MHLPAFFVLCTYAGILGLIRIFMAGSFDLSDLIWNLILAFMPYFMAGWFVSWKGWYRWIAFAFWILFLPNSFYILTDFVHLSDSPEMVYYDILFITSMAFAGMVSAYASMELVHRYMNIRFHKKLGWLIIMSVVMLSMVGVYLGRFLRFNSWDVIRDPINLMREAFSMVISNGQVWNIADPDRLAASRLFEAGAMGLVQFVFLYGSFFLLVYMYMYHVKEK